jgi:large subunit ribosomal protein L3
MPKTSKPRAGSLQYWPRKRAEKFLPSSNWKALELKGNKGLLGFIGYKVGMKSAIVKDNTPDSLTKGKRIAIPVTLVELPPMKILCARFYKNSKVLADILADNLDKELKKKIKMPKNKTSKKIEDIKDFDDLRIIVYSSAKQTSVKKTPDIVEIGLGGSLDEKVKFIQDNLGKELSASNIFKAMQLVDLRGLTKGKGLSGPVKRFGVSLRQHKSEKGVRRPGNIGPWHPDNVTFRIPMAGQLGMFSRIQYNGKIIELGKIKEKNINPKEGWHKYGNINTEYAIVYGSIQGSRKRQLLLTFPLRKTKKTEKKNYEVIKLD